MLPQLWPLSVDTALPASAAARCAELMFDVDPWAHSRLRLVCRSACAYVDAHAQSLQIKKGQVLRLKPQVAARFASLRALEASTDSPRDVTALAAALPQMRLLEALVWQRERLRGRQETR